MSCVNNEGLVFKLTPNPDGSWTESVLYSFAGDPDGAFPGAGLIFDSTGSLYGTTAGGGTGHGTAFKLTAKSGRELDRERTLQIYGRQGRICARRRAGV